VGKDAKLSQNASSKASKKAVPKKGDQMNLMEKIASGAINLDEVSSQELE
jgi:hypothetical protein